MRKYKQHLRAADMLIKAINELKLTKLRNIQQKFQDLSARSSDLSKDHRIFEKAISKRWYGSAEKIRVRVGRNLIDFANHLDHFRNLINTEDTKLPNPRDIVAELIQIEDEFGDMKIDLKTATISVVTESITMDEISLGPFEIRLYLNQIKKLPTDSPYRIIALEPNPAGSDCEVTHPHVSHEKLCEGDGFVPIRKAIQQGRLCDFFQIILQTLQTYNPESPYVSLGEWQGVSCYDCGYTVSGDDVYYCEDCQNDYCSSCSTYCQICDCTICLGCSYECPCCQKPVCRDCVATCSECDSVYCKDCINDKNLCNHCQEQREEQENEEIEEESTLTSTKPEVQSDSLGQTRIPA